MDTKDYWRKVRATASQLDPESAQRDRDEEDPTERRFLKKSDKPCWLMSVADEMTGSVAGMVVVMKPYAAAERLFAKTHRIATPEEIEIEEKRRATARESILAEDAARKQSVTTHTHVTVDTQSIVDGVTQAMSERKQPRAAQQRTTEPAPA